MLRLSSSKALALALVSQVLVPLCFAVGKESSLPRSTPEAEGIPSQAILNLIDSWEAVGGMNSYMIMRHGKVVAEGWWAPYAAEKPHVMYSVSKSFTSAGIGIAIEEGHLSLDDTVRSFFPDQAPESPSEHLSGMRVSDLLTMTTGHRADTIGRIIGNDDRTLVERFLALDVEDRPGTHFVYNTGATYMLSAILQKATGEKLFDYLQPRLFQPLEFTNHSWDESPEGISLGGFGLNITTEDLAKFGQLYLQQGEWHGQYLVSKNWVIESTSKQASSGSNPENNWEQGYGYQFWNNTVEGTYRADSAFGQFCIVLPHDELVVTITAGTSDTSGLLDAVWEVLIPAIDANAIEPDTSIQQALRRRSDALAITQIEGKESAPLANSVSGSLYQLAENTLGLESVQFAFEGGKSNVVFKDANGSHSIEFEHGDWAEGVTALLIASLGTAQETHHYQARGAWTTDDTFALQIIFDHSPYEANLRFQFGGDLVVIDGEQNVSFQSPAYPTISGARSSRTR